MTKEAAVEQKQAPSGPVARVLCYLTRYNSLKVNSLQHNCSANMRDGCKDTAFPTFRQCGGATESGGISVPTVLVRVPCHPRS